MLNCMYESLVKLGYVSIKIDGVMTFDNGHNRHRRCPVTDAKYSINNNYIHLEVDDENVKAMPLESYLETLPVMHSEPNNARAIVGQINDYHKRRVFAASNFNHPIRTQIVISEIGVRITVRGISVSGKKINGIHHIKATK